MGRDGWILADVFVWVFVSLSKTVGHLGQLEKGAKYDGLREIWVRINRLILDSSFSPFFFPSPSLARSIPKLDTGSCYIGLPNAVQLSHWLQAIG